MQFTRLRLSGFKSFVDPTELVIEPGLTGIVGPNGCGKSNLLEALRWVMGESSAKSMRGSGMDDVIFAGTKTRPARNLAEVTLGLDNEERTAPTIFNDETQLEISRRIERHSGSAYRLNGKDVRAKDIQLLFADASTGAHSPSLVSQGRIGSLISAKPRERRAILEEAAGISGLHTRRKEAESKLRSAEHNIERLTDIEGQLSGQIKSLQSQVNLALRYKKTSEEIRELKEQLFISQWQDLSVKIDLNQEKYKKYSEQISSMTIVLGRFSKETSLLAAKIPNLRKNDNEISSALQKIIIEKNALKGEEELLHTRRERLGQQLNQIAADKERQEEIIIDADEKMQSLKAGKEALQKEIRNEGEGEEKLSENLAKNQSLTSDAQSKLEQLSLKQAEDKAARTHLEKEMTQSRKKLDFLLEQSSAMRQRLEKLQSNSFFANALKVSEDNLEKAEQKIKRFHKDYLFVEEEKQNFIVKEQEFRKGLMEVQAGFARVTAEKTALQNILTAGHNPRTKPLMDYIQIKEGYEIALGAAFADELEISIDEREGAFWKNHSQLKPLSLQKLPLNAEPLSSFVTFLAPLDKDFLKARLDQIGVMRSAEIAASLMGQLLIGQKLVSLKGGVWRWDGLCISPDMPSAAAVRLSQRNKLKDIEKLELEEQKKLDIAHKKVSKSEEITMQGNKKAHSARIIWQDAEINAAELRKELSQSEQQSVRHQSEENALKDRLSAMDIEIKEANIQANETRNLYKIQPELIDFGVKITKLRDAAQEKRNILAESRLAHDLFCSAKEARRMQVIQMETEYDEWALRLKAVKEHLKELVARKENGVLEQKKLENRPGEIVEIRRRLNVKTDEMTEKRSAAIKILNEAEEGLKIKEDKAREAERLLGKLREEAARLEAKLSGLKEQQDNLSLRLKDELKLSLQEIIKPEIKKESETQKNDYAKNYDQIHLKLEKAKYRRDSMGQVNLTAESQLNEMSEKFELALKEREELQAAIEKLRGAISELNREGRSRMLKAFEEVNGHFRGLFIQLFGGGEAHLQLTESNDPLDAGLEIMASPPGKKMQNLGLLSGGEQALTALSLIFAVFMTNPAPICVLDEVDAPLDDANVERFCDLLDEMNKLTSTRFLIVTHNAVTMSRMQRLFGVTMAEQGISKLVSVDLESAENLRDSM